MALVMCALPGQTSDDVLSARALEIEEWTAWPDVRSRAFRGDRRARSLLPDAVSGERVVVREVGSRAP